MLWFEEWKIINMKKYLKIILSCISCFLLVVSTIFGYLYAVNLSKIKEKQAQLSDINEIINNNDGSFYCDSNYKIFWGRWKITKIIGENIKYGADKDANNLIGVEYQLEEQIISVSNAIYSDFPVYQYYVVDNDTISVKENIPILIDMPTPKDLGLNGDFVIFVSVLSRWQQDFELNFYIKDSETLILYANNAFYEMKLIDHGKG